MWQQIFDLKKMLSRERGKFIKINTFKKLMVLMWISAFSNRNFLNIKWKMHIKEKMWKKVFFSHKKKFK